MTTTSPSGIKQATVPPVKSLTSPFIGWTISAIKDFAEEYLNVDYRISGGNLLILDEQSLIDSTCLLVSRCGYNDDDEEDNDGMDLKWRERRSDFKSGLTVLNTSQMGCGGEEQLADAAADKYGVLRS